MKRQTRWSGLLPLALLGALVATLCDANHALTLTLSYPDAWSRTADFPGQAGWVFPGFFAAFLGMGSSYALVANWLGGRLAVTQSRAPGNWQAAVETLLLFAFVYLVSGFGNDWPLLLGVIFYTTFVLRLLFTYERGWLLLLAVLMAIGGMAAEGLLAEFGLVAYRLPEVFHVPWWLGGLYMHGAFALREGTWPCV